MTHGSEFLHINSIPMCLLDIVMNQSFMPFFLYREFVGCVRCIRILSPAEVQQMSEEGMKLLDSAAAQGLNGAA